MKRMCVSLVPSGGEFRLYRDDEWREFGSTGARKNFYARYFSQHGPTSRTSMVANSAAGQAAAASIASSLEQSSMKKPPTISFASANGPSIMVRLPSRLCTGKPFDVGPSES